MTDILIPLGKGSRHNNIELRYCLRSIEKHLTGVGNLFIVGECPEWLHGVVHVPATDNTNGWNRARNIYRKIMAGIKYVDIRMGMTAEDYLNKEVTVSGVVLSDNFLFMNDDHFLLADYETGSFPYYHRGPIQPHRIPNEPQTRQYENTIKILAAAGLDTLDFDIHCPILYNKKDFTKCFEGLQWKEYGYGIKSMYGNWAGVVGELHDDLKFSELLLQDTIRSVLADRKWFSIGDRCLKNGEMQKVLERLYPVPSRWEK